MDDKLPKAFWLIVALIIFGLAFLAHSAVKQVREADRESFAVTYGEVRGK